jgi:hypothetical protein
MIVKIKYTHHVGMQQNAEANYLVFSHSFDVHKKIPRQGGDRSCASVILNARIIAPSEDPNISELQA